MADSFFLYSLLTVVGSAFFFAGLSRLLAKNNCIGAKVQSYRIATWYNILTSLIHSIVSSMLCFVCFYVEPSLLFNLGSNNTEPIARFTTNVSVGYFVYDFIENIKRFDITLQWPVLIHHVIIVLEYTSIGWYLGLYNYVTVSLFSEINSVFLHLRQLFHFSKMDQTRLMYKLNKHMNIFTFLTVRMAVIPWVFIRGNFYGEFPPGYILTVGNFGVFLLCIINVVLLWRIIKNDYLGFVKENKVR